MCNKSEVFMNCGTEPKMVEVDLRLFVTCRLCLDVQGHFQIDPRVQHHIKYCFDIDVEPFDGLPQLICKKCKNILREHYAVKTNFINKQKELKAKAQDNAQKFKKSPSPQDELENNPNTDNDRPSSRQEESDSSNYMAKTKKKKKVKKKRIINRLLSSSCDDLDSNDYSTSEKEIKTKNHTYNENPKTWDANLSKYFVCRVCARGFQDKEGIICHIKEHSFIHTKYKDVFKMSCLVVMEKSDNKPNVCNSNNSVVYSSDSIIQNNHNPFYYIVYHPKTSIDLPNSPQSYNTESKKLRSSESTDSEISTRKRRRLLSRSSRETVVINQHSEHEVASPVAENNGNLPTVIDCIDLGDSSDNGSYKSNKKISESISYKNNEIQGSKSMHNIIKMCHNRYTKQVDSLDKKKPDNDKINEDFLQHKVLSIGRKIINNKGFNCTGLLRFLEYKDLGVVWKEKSILNATNDSKYVRIATRVRGNESSDINNDGWKKINLIKFGNGDICNAINILKKLKSFGNFKNKTKVSSVTNEVESIDSVEQLPRISSVFSHTDLEITKTESDNLLLQKLLNKNPVSNPKQLPKKVNNENYPKSMKVFSAPNTVPFVNTTQIDENNEMDINTMPIVTSTMSLAPWVDKQKTSIVPPVDPVNSSNNKKTYPRIKVKPVSELMPENSTNTNINTRNIHASESPNVSQTQNVLWSNQNIVVSEQQTWPSQVNPVITVADGQIWPNQNIAFAEQQLWPISNVTLSKQQNTLSVQNVSQCYKPKESAKEYILLDTLELPNTKTASPFLYLQNLLLLHNITLLDAEQPLPVGSVSLIKLKLVYQQEKCEPITLCLTLFCIKNIFSIKIKDMNHKDVNINNLSANWQWQLLKIYSNEVVKKVLQAAVKVSSETYQYTQDFFTLLRSIKSKSEMT